MAFTRPFLFTLVKYERCRNWTSGAVQWHSLRQVATNAVITQLGQVAEFGINSRFTCGGKYEVPPSKPIKLVYRQAAAGPVSEWNEVDFPGNVSEADMRKLFDVASYGYEGKDVIDKNYRNTFKLEPDNFITSFQLSATPILQEIQTIVPMVVGLKAESYELNIYARGGFFKACVDAPIDLDAPRSEKMFGSLVVCLPIKFSGGELIVRHRKEEIKYDWSSTASDTSSTLHWAAFFNDVEHEVLPVSEGYRVTLTYNLSYQSKASDSTFDVKTCTFYETLQTALSNPVFMRDGGVLGFKSHYSYVSDIQWADLLTHIIPFSSRLEDRANIIQELNWKVSCDEFLQLSKGQQMNVLREAGFFEKSCKQILAALPTDFPLLKGADYIVVESAKSLGLPVCVKPLLSGDDAYDRNFKYALKDFSQSMFVDRYSNVDDVRDGYHHLEPLQMFGGATCRYKPQDITWCQKLRFHQPAAALLRYGNEAGIDLWYKSAAILVRIPKWGEYRQKLIAVSTGESCGITEASATHGDGMVKDFGDIFQDFDGIMREETQEVNAFFEQLLNNQYVNEVEGLVDKLKEMQSVLRCAIRGRKRINEHDICHARFVLHKLRDVVNDPWTSERDAQLSLCIEHLHRTMLRMQPIFL